MNDFKDPQSVKDEDRRPSADIVGVYEEYALYSPEEEKRVLRKIDMMILPFVRLHPFLNQTGI